MRDVRTIPDQSTFSGSVWKGPYRADPGASRCRDDLQAVSKREWAGLNDHRSGTIALQRFHRALDGGQIGDCFGVKFDTGGRSNSLDGEPHGNMPMRTGGLGFWARTIDGRAMSAEPKKPRNWRLWTFPHPSGPWTCR